jgi:thiol:disulfide interchange protein DsbC
MNFAFFLKSFNVFYKAFLLSGIALFMSASSAYAQDDLPQSYKLLMQQFENINADDIKPSSITGLLEVTFDGTLLYATKDGRFIIQGDVYDVLRKINVTEEQRAIVRAEALASSDPDTMIMFDVADGNPDYTVTVFTDIDCGYCRKLHREMAAYNEEGIRVQYMFFPRSGPNTESWTKANNVWCSEDRAAALTRSKSGEVLPDIECGETPVESHYNLGLAAGVTGTPAIMTDKGVLISGYVPAAQLRDRLETLGEVTSNN